MIIDTQSDFQIFQKIVLNKKTHLDAVFLVRNPRQKVWSNIRDEVLSSNSNIPSTSTRRTTRLHKQCDQFEMQGSHYNFGHQSGADTELSAGKYSEESIVEEMDAECDEESVIDTEDEDESWDDITEESAFIDLTRTPKPNDVFGSMVLNQHQQLFNMLSSASRNVVSVSNDCIGTVNETAEAVPSMDTNSGNASEQTDEPKTDQSSNNNTSKENDSILAKANCDNNKTNDAAIEAIRRFFAKRAAHTQTQTQTKAAGKDSN